MCDDAEGWIMLAIAGLILVVFFVIPISMSTPITQDADEYELMLIQSGITVIELEDKNIKQTCLELTLADFQNKIATATEIYRYGRAFYYFAPDEICYKYWV